MHSAPPSWPSGWRLARQSRRPILRQTKAAGSDEPSLAQQQPQDQDDHNQDSDLVDGIHVLNRQLHCGRHGTRSSCRTNRRAITASLTSPLRAARFSRSATWRQVLCWRRSAGRRPSRARMSPSVCSVAMVGILSGRGSLRDQSGRARGTLLTAQLHILIGEAPLKESSVCAAAPV